MRAVVTLSLPKTQAVLLKKNAARYGFESVSEYVRTLIDQDKDLISEKELVVMTKEAEQDYRRGRLKAYTSVRELL